MADVFEEILPKRALAPDCSPRNMRLPRANRGDSCQWRRARRSAECPLRFVYRSRDIRGQTTSRTLTGLPVVFADLVRLGDEPVLAEERTRSRNRLIDFIAGLLDCPYFGFYLSGVALRDDGDHGHHLSSERAAHASEIDNSRGLAARLASHRKRLMMHGSHAVGKCWTQRVNARLRCAAQAFLSGDSCRLLRDDQVWIYN